jgi:hypothetical protein
MTTPGCGCGAYGPGRAGSPGDSGSPATCCGGYSSEPPTTEAPADEVESTLDVLVELLRPVVADGGRKRAAGTKVHWTVDPGHEAALERHLDVVGAGPDADSGACPWVHVAARALMLAGQAEVRAARRREVEAELARWDDNGGRP